MDNIVARKKLIEVDLPLDEINAEAKREKSIRHGHPSTLHLWWARRPLAACRAVIFASMVDDPSSCPDEFPTENDQCAERNRLHNIIRNMVKWESTDENKTESRTILNMARYEIARSIARSRGEAPPDKNSPTQVLRYLNNKALPIYDPFAGGGSIPLEAQRLGLRAIASDLNPVAVLINKALIELPPKFAGRAPVNPNAAGLNGGSAWRGSSGLANDIRYYGKWIRDEAQKCIGHLYPKVKLHNGVEAVVIAWLWARTVPCPNPACGIAMPLMVTFQLSKKLKNRHWTRPVVDRQTNTVTFVVQNHDAGVPATGTVNRNGATCIACSTTSSLAYVREQSRAGKMGEQMTAIVVKGNQKRLYLSPIDEHIRTAFSCKTNMQSIPKQKIPTTVYKLSGRGYGITHWYQLFTSRQLTALTTFSELISRVHALVLRHGASIEYAGALCTFLTFAISRLADRGSAFCSWDNSPKMEALRNTFGRQAIQMVWDFAEGNPLSNSSGNWTANTQWIAEVVERLPSPVNSGVAEQADASSSIHSNGGPVIVTDPPYYDNISYAELSDFFYVWLRPLLRRTYPDMFASILVPIDAEMIAAPRFANARERFEELMCKTLRLIREKSSPDFPSSIFYAYKQQEEDRDGKTSTGWDTMLSALISAGFQIVGTWPMRTEMSNRSNSMSANSLASSVILVWPYTRNRSAGRYASSFLACTQRGITSSFDPDAVRQHRPSGPGPSCHRTRNGGIHSLFQGAGRQWRGSISA